MPLFGRSDVMSVAVPVTSGGCSEVHSRPVVEGKPEPDWDLERVCVKCAAVMRGDPLWSATLAEIPETPDERLSREDAEKRGERAHKKAQAELSVRQQELSEQIVAMMERTHPSAVDPDPDFIARLVAQEVAKALAQPQEPEPHPVPVYYGPDDELPEPAALERLHGNSLKRMCRERGLDDKGEKAVLIKRLTAA